MDEIIKAIGKSEYDVAAMLILLDHLEQDNLEKLLYFFVYKLIDKKITEIIFIEMIDYINRTKIDFSAIKHIEQISELLIDKNYKTSSRILITLYEIKNINNELSKLISDILKTNGILKKKIRSIISSNTTNKAHQFEVIIKLYNIICETKKYIKAFNKISINIHPSKLPNINNLASTKEAILNPNIEQFEYYCKEEILNRLILLKKYFGIHLLANMNVKIITLDNFIEMNYNEKIKYYFCCSKNIKKSINNYLKLLKRYIKLQKYYSTIISQKNNIDIYTGICDKILELSENISFSEKNQKNIPNEQIK